MGGEREQRDARSAHAGALWSLMETEQQNSRLALALSLLVTPSHLDFPGGAMTRLSSPVGVQALLGRPGFRA